MHMYTYKILTLHSSSNCLVVNNFFFKLHDAPMGSYGRICLKNYREMLDETWRVIILYVHMYIKFSCT
jgi:hypothetical protein